MSEIANSAAAFGLLGILRAFDKQEEERKSRQEEVFVPFNFAPLAQAEPSLLSRNHSHPISISGRLPQEKRQERNIA